MEKIPSSQTLHLIFLKIGNFILLWRGLGGPQPEPWLCPVLPCLSILV